MSVCLDVSIQCLAFADTLTGRRAEEQALIAISGIGQITARGVFALAPELGRFSHKAIASIAGLAPDLRDSGQGYRRMRLGRTGSRPLLFMAAFAGACSHPRSQDFYRRLLVAGKARRPRMRSRCTQTPHHRQRHPQHPTGSTDVMTAAHMAARRFRRCISAFGPSGNRLGAEKKPKSKAHSISVAGLGAPAGGNSEGLRKSAT
jgi:hypothetical protein